LKLTPDQLAAQELTSGPAKHILLEGGSRSGKTFLHCRTIATRALVAPQSRHGILRYRFNHVKAAIIHDTWPKMMQLCYPEVHAASRLDRSDWYYQMPNGSQVWFGGLDEKERTEKVLGQEYATLLLNEISQIPWSSRNIAVTRLAQVARYKLAGREGALRLKMLYDCNPPSKGHWSYRVFHEGRDPDTGKALVDRGSYVHMQMNPDGNMDNLPADYLATLASLPLRMRERFLFGRYAEIAAGALWTTEVIDKWRDLDSLPEMQRIVIAVDPSGSSDEEQQANDAVGIVVAGLGRDGRAYVLEDLTLRAGPQTWGNIVAAAYDRWNADRVIAEKNYGGEMVRFVLQTARAGLPVTLVNATRGKVVRAEPISALTEQGKVRFAGTFTELEDELCAFTANGYQGERSPNRADAFVWAITALFPAVIDKPAPPAAPEQPLYYHSGNTGWMA
jgi:predicted phage terminase large subunit-like protein